MNERYETRGLIARTGGGEVHLGWDRQTNREIAIKRASAPDGEASLLNEAAILRAVQHPNIVSILDSGHDNNGVFTVLELAAGQTLEAEVGQCPLDIAEFGQLVEQTLAGVSAAHAKSVLHLDLKPQNIMVARDDTGRLQVKILDFGVARTSPVPGQIYKSDAGPVMGSLFFMAPERFDREPEDARADLYSLGCVYYHALAGRVPFDGDTAPQVMVAHLRHLFTPLAEIRADLPAFVLTWVEWLFSRRAEDRPASAATALAAFREGLAGC